MVLIIINLILFSIFNSHPKSPNDFVWKNRVLIIQTNESDSSWFQENLRQDLKDRKLLLFQFESNELIRTNSEGQIDTNKFLEKLNITSATNNHWVLIGLDGGVKISGVTNPLPLEIFRIIDSMPMRQSEVRKANL